MISDNNFKTYEPIIKTSGNISKITIPKERIGSGVEYIEINSDYFTANAGDDGYYVVATVYGNGSHICKFTEKEDEELILKQNLMPIVGIKKKDCTLLVTAEGMKSGFYVRVGVKDNKYFLALRFVLDKNEPYEDVSLDIRKLADNADYNDMAREYRQYQLERGACVPLKERIKSNPSLAYAAEAVEIRIRMGWKPAPPEVLEQTLENEPEMHVACTFDRVKDIIDELKKQGVEKAQLCLVGWNKSGHDGRWPTIFPVEEKLGGEKKLRELIKYAQDNGYQIVCHTNSTDWYNIADKEFPKEDSVAQDASGSFVLCGKWSGGQGHNLCPVKAYEIAKQELPKVAELGFSGLHYIDVMSIVPLRRCHNPSHPATERDTEGLYNQIGDLSHELFGGFASEGAFDFASPYLDYALYVTFAGSVSSLFDEEIPLWQLVYHGIILSNPSAATINYVIKDESSRKKLMAYGGRPSFYIYSSFVTGGNWMGDEDLVCDTDEQLKYTVSKIKEAYDELETNKHLQLEFMESYENTDDGQKVRYSNGEEIIV